MATVAVFIALGGGAYALTLPKNSVGSRQLKKNAVTGSKLKKNAVTSSKVKNGSLLAGDFKPGQLPAGPRGPQGPRGLEGPKGLQGIPGQSATKLFAYIRDPTAVNQAANAAVVQYGSGVTGVDDPTPGNSAYTVNFNRSLVNCVVVAVPGAGDPSGSVGFPENADTSVDVGAGNANQALVTFVTSAGVVDTSFMISAFC